MKNLIAIVLLGLILSGCYAYAPSRQPKYVNGAEHNDQNNDQNSGLMDAVGSMFNGVAERAAKE